MLLETILSLAISAILARAAFVLFINQKDQIHSATESQRLIEKGYNDNDFVDVDKVPDFVQAAIPNAKNFSVSKSMRGDEKYFRAMISKLHKVGLQAVLCDATKVIMHMDDSEKIVYVPDSAGNSSIEGDIWIAKI